VRGTPTGIGPGADGTLVAIAIAVVVVGGPNAFGNGLRFCITCGRGMC